MKILQVSNRVPWPLNEGGTIGIYNFTRAYAELGHEVVIYCLDGKKHNTPVIEAQEELSKYARVLIQPLNTDVVAKDALLHLLQNKSYNVSRFYDADFESKIIELLQFEKFDVIQVEGTFVGPYIHTIRKYHTGVIALRMHNVEYEIWERLASNERNPFKKYYQRILAKQLKKYEASLLPMVDITATVTDDDGQKFKALHPTGEYCTIPAGIDLDVWKYTPSDSFKRFYHIGSMEWHANAEAVNWYMDKVHSLICLEDNEYGLHLAGKGIKTPSFASHAQLSVHANVCGPTRRLCSAIMEWQWHSLKNTRSTSRWKARYLYHHRRTRHSIHRRGAFSNR
jgi:polysaccharide biosynthesis protein PslH